MSGLLALGCVDITTRARQAGFVQRTLPVTSYDDSSAIRSMSLFLCLCPFSVPGGPARAATPAVPSATGPRAVSLPRTRTGLSWPKLLEMAGRLGARVQAKHGEFYNRQEDMPCREPSATSLARSPRPWWRVWKGGGSRG